MSDNRATTLLTAEVVWDEFQQTNSDQLAVLENAAVALLEGHLDDKLRKTAADAATDLLLRVGAWGLIRGARLTAEVEGVFRSPAELGRGHALRLCDDIGALRAELQRAYESGGPEPVLRNDCALVLLIDCNQRRRERFILAGLRTGVRVEAVRTPSDAYSAICEHLPDAVLVWFDEEESARIEDALAWRSLITAPPPIYIGGTRIDGSLRLALAKAGITTIFESSFTPAQVLVDIAADLQLSRTSARTAITNNSSGVAGGSATDERLLLLSNDPKLAGSDSGLSWLQFETRVSVSDFWDALGTTSPQALAIDIDTIGDDATLLCRALRSAPSVSGLPLACIGSGVDGEFATELLAAGADDVVDKLEGPRWATELGARLLLRLERYRKLKASAELDGRTGLLSRRRAEDLIERMLRVADHQTERFALALLSIDHSDLDETAFDAGLTAIARVLRQQFRSEDVLARWTAEEIIVGLYGATRDDGVQRLAQCVERLNPANSRPSNLRISAGVAQFPDDGGDRRTLERAAEEALSRAHLMGGNRVLPAGWGPGYTAIADVDVVIVEADEALVNVLRYSIEMRGLSCRWYADGAAAAQGLTGNTPLRARVILLALGIPSLDGLSLLRTLTREGVTTRTRVIVISARSGESEVVQALELGAFDYVPKPVSVPLLLQRIRRALAP